MKKYRNSIIVLIITLLSLSVFYVNLVFSSANLPDFYIKQTNGDAKLSKSLMLDAFYSQNEPLKVTNKGSDYLSELPYFEQLDYWEKNSDTAELNELIEEYPSFMRGKSYSTRLYNDTNQVIFVESNYDYSSSKGMHNFRLNIEQLNKETEDTNSFEVAIPNQEQSGYIEILDIQVIMDELHVITLSESRNDDVTRMLHEYTLNLKKEKLIDDNFIIKTEKGNEKQSFYITGLTEINPTQSNPYFIFHLNQSTYDEEQETDQNVSSDLYSYNYKKGQLEKLKIPANLKEKILQQGEYYLAYDNNSLYASIPIDKDGKKIINMIKYDFENQKITKDYMLSTEPDTYEHYISLYQNKMILTYRGKDGQPFIKIFNFDNGNSIFEGTIEVKNKDPKLEYKDFHINAVKGL